MWSSTILIQKRTATYIHATKVTDKVNKLLEIQAFKHLHTGVDIFRTEHKVSATL